MNIYNMFWFKVLITDPPPPAPVRLLRPLPLNMPLPLLLRECVLDRRRLGHASRRGLAPTERKQCVASSTMRLAITMRQ